MPPPAAVVLDTPREAGAGINILLHPLPVLSISDHLTRATAQAHAAPGSSSAGAAPRVYGALLGTQTGRDVEVQNSFEMRMRGDGSVVDAEWLVARLASYKQVFPTFDFLGWYGCGGAPSATDLAVHKQLLEHNESAIFLQLSPSRSALHDARSRAELPVAIYEGVIELAKAPGEDAAMAPPEGAGPELFFVRSDYRLETGEAERIAVDHTSRPPEGGSGTSSLVANLTTSHNAISMLAERIQHVHAYVRGVREGSVPRDEEALRQVRALLASRPRMRQVPEWQAEFETEYNDVLLTSYLASMTKGLHSLNELVDKFDTMQSGRDELDAGRGDARSGGRARKPTHAAGTAY